MSRCHYKEYRLPKAAVLTLFPVLAGLVSCVPYYEGKELAEQDLGSGLKLVVQAYSEWEVTVPVYVRLYRGKHLLGSSRVLNSCDPAVLESGRHGLLFYASQDGLVVVEKDEPDEVICVASWAHSPPWIIPANQMIPPRTDHGADVTRDECLAVVRKISDKTGQELHLPDYWNWEDE